ncbi:MAG: hypothetical protein A3I43_03255 [Omnitrophica WOR_2 bacterium RIFCSPLOWO2_02_FULL_50_19]|nr:MAG: hypothetical protein A3H12_00770 [Candidatus Uhrbacteria bacterium RIFCSPLOWO2_12_FULL_47_9]OGX32661.1 MAG: hypothetical protein A3I43_03255 [Omnitrophica WOR_2 bacterium RIFCSPLOWO2_02_FULL_50_19]
MDESLYNKLTELGFPLFHNKEPRDANGTLAEMAKSTDLRLWEGFPVVLANSAEKGLLDYGDAKRLLDDNRDKNNLDRLAAMSLALYKNLSLKFYWTKKLQEKLPAGSGGLLKEYLAKLKDAADFKVGEKTMSPARLKNVFNNYYKQASSGLSDLLSTKEQFGLEFAMSQVFSPKQKELFLKKLHNEKLNKTEREYYSRVVRKKVQALANSELNNLAQKLMRY